MPKLDEIQEYNLLKYNNKNYELGLEKSESDTEIMSPYIQIRDVILGQGDFVKKQQDILNFSVSFTRDAIPEKIDVDVVSNELENVHWRYCIKTDTKLLPKFLFTLARTFIEDNSNYQLVMEKIIKEIGVSSDDGDAWVDKYSGYVIKVNDFDTEEGYEETGFKKITRDILEEEAGEGIINQLLKIKYQTQESKMISNIIDAISTFMGINIMDHKEFIIKNVIDDLKANVPEKDEYEEKVKEVSKSNKRMRSYKDLFNTTLLYLTLGMILITIQINIPTIRSKKTFPNCNRSFDGYPVYGTGDMSGLKYLSCVSYNIRSSAEPWNVLQKTNQDTIEKAIQTFIDKYIIVKPEIKRKIQEKLEYLQLNVESDIPNEYDVRNWINFLPPLQTFTIKKLDNIPNDFISDLKNELKSGNKKQHKNIITLKSKNILFSLLVQENIQKILDKKELILKNSVNVPFFQNSCCIENKKMDTIEYFIKDNKYIETNINFVKLYSAIIEDINLITSAQSFYCTIKSKIIYPPISTDFSEKTIYKAFIIFCNFNSLRPINGNLLRLCGEKPVYLNVNDSTDEQISKLKKNGVEYSKKMFLKLLQAVNRNNLIDIKLNETKNINLVEPLHQEILKIKNENKSYVNVNLINLLEVQPVRNLSNYLFSETQKMKSNVLDFLKLSNFTKKEEKSVTDTIENLMDWKFKIDDHNINFRITDDDQYNPINFIKNYINYFASVFPKIILNKVDYDNVSISDYWELSTYHKNDLRSYITDFYKPLKNFYGNTFLTNLLDELYGKLNGLMDFINKIPSVANHTKFNKRTTDLLFEYFFFQVLDNYISLTESNTLIQKTLQNKYNVQANENEGEEESKENEISVGDYLDDVNQGMDVTINIKIFLTTIF